MIKKGLKKNLTDFLEMPNKLLGKKRRQINKSKQKISLREISPPKTIISNWNSSNKKELPVFTLAIITSQLKAKDYDIAIFGVDIYCATCHWKKLKYLLWLWEIYNTKLKKSQDEDRSEKCCTLKIPKFSWWFLKKRLRNCLLTSKVWSQDSTRRRAEIWLRIIVQDVF